MDELNVTFQKKYRHYFEKPLVILERLCYDNRKENMTNENRMKNVNLQLTNRCLKFAFFVRFRHQLFTKEMEWFYGDAGQKEKTEV